MLLTLIPASCILSVCAARYSEIYFVTVVCGNYNKYGPGRWTDARGSEAWSEATANASKCASPDSKSQLTAHGVLGTKYSCTGPTVQLNS